MFLEKLIIFNLLIKEEFLKNCYLIGAIDGDGTTQLYENKLKKTKTVQVSLVSASFDYASWVENRFDDITKGYALINRTKGGKRKLVHDRQYFKANVSGLAACALIDYFRQFPVPKLDRKWNKPEIVDYIESQKLLYPDKFLTLEIPPQYR